MDDDPHRPTRAPRALDSDGRTRLPTRRFLLIGLPLLLFLGAETAFAKDFDSEDCMLCHSEASNWDFTDPKSARLFILSASFEGSVHQEAACTDCHDGIEDLPHDEKLPPPNCAGCHDDEQTVYSHSLHGMAVEKKDPLAPHCWDCHGGHDIIPSASPEARTNPINIPQMCGACHAEDAPVARERNIAQHDILQHYAESIHGEGVLKKGLTVTAVCTSCHTAHNVLPHTDPNSSIHRENVVKTCTQCHALIEQVHRKVIEGALWEKEPDKIPICIDCHQPHDARKVYYEEGVSDRDCMACHAQPIETAHGPIPSVDQHLLAGSTHSKVRCAQCHTGVDKRLDRPCETVVAKVDCSICHAEQVQQHERSYHGQLAKQGDPDAPVCLDCHSAHGTLPQTNPASPTFPNNVPTLCGKCHQEGHKAAARHHSSQTEIIENYSESIHGKGLLESGLLVTAVCTDCHTAHLVLPKTDPESSVNPANIRNTCGACHHGIQETFDKSIHSPLVSKSEQPLPVCSDCHTAHTISRTDAEAFKLGMLETCGKCHADVAETYFDTYHGKVSKLGSAGAAKCHNCHGAHDILPVTDPNSRLSRENIVETCAQCHPGSHRQFAGYLTHATHHDPDKYPALFWTFWAMTGLLIGTFAFFGIHTLAWIPRSFVEQRRKKREPRPAEEKYILRFDRVTRQFHFIMILSFFGLALTGMTLKFSYMPWAVWLSNLLGGFNSAGIIHRICAITMVILFAFHLGYVIKKKREKGLTWKGMLSGTRTLAPTWRDVVEFFQSLKWFARMGPRPRYAMWTYWEKFDYLAVFWGIAIIGSTGFILWFPEFFTRFLPGWIINVATIIHSDEALLAVGFIFTIHFFNTHFRPDKFPMDMVMFTGCVPAEELKRDKPDLYRELEESGKLEEMTVPPPSKEFLFWARLFGFLALFTGLTLALFIIWSMLFGYR
ncbi:MAG: cytochrome b/b6 domain-containing protein [Candidatus Omnitrophica bacterium]|nr:cytochrome b/b6 domain-containing protein [Candidatus Omnitrophota bacterium]